MGSFFDNPFSAYVRNPYQPVSSPQVFINGIEIDHVPTKPAEEVMPLNDNPIPISFQYVSPPIEKIAASVQDSKGVNPRRKIAKVVFSPDLLVHLLLSLKGDKVVEADGLPDDAKPLYGYYDANNNTFAVFMTSDEFCVVDEGCPIPEIAVTLTNSTLAEKITDLFGSVSVADFVDRAIGQANA